MSGQGDDLTRLRAEYASRAQTLADSDVYSPFNVAQLFLLQSRQRAVLRLLRKQGFYPLEGKRILEIGCGGGGVLHEYLGYGATPGLLHGIDLLPDRLADARGWLPMLPLVCGDGQRLPYPAGSFDLVLQYTAFSSILDDEVKRRVAGEMMRVLRKPGGLVVWYDFWLNPTNPQTRGIRPGEIRQLFPDSHLSFQRITLAPPISRKLTPVSWVLSTLLESLRLLNTHYLVAIRAG